MAAPMPKHPHLRGNFAPIRMESNAPDCIVHGEIPAELNGTYYRNGPDPQFAPRGMHHWFAGDGMISRAQSDVASSAAPDMMETRSLIPATHCPLSTTNES